MSYVARMFAKKQRNLIPPDFLTELRHTGAASSQHSSTYWGYCEVNAAGQQRVSGHEANTLIYEPDAKKIIG